LRVASAAAMRALRKIWNRSIVRGRKPTADSVGESIWIGLNVTAKRGSGSKR
jgi:hypothetical protein